MLVTLILALSLYSSGVMDYSDSRISSINMLASRSRCSLSLNGNILWINNKISWYHRHDKDHTSGAMDPSSLLSLWNSLYLMHPRFMLEVLVNILPIHSIGGILAPLANSHVFLELFLLHFKALVSAIVLIHHQNVFCEKTGLRASSGLHDLERATAEVLCLCVRQDDFDDFFLDCLDLTIFL